MIHVEFIGRLGADAEVKTSKNGTNFMTMRMATDDYSNGKKETVWVNVVVPNDRYAKIAKYFTKGKMLWVHGTQSISVYKSHNGDYVPSIEVMVDRIDFPPTTGGKKDSGSDDKVDDKLMDTGELLPKPAKEKAGSAASVASAVASSDSTDDLPF